MFRSIFRAVAVAAVILAPIISITLQNEADYNTYQGSFKEKYTQSLRPFSDFEADGFKARWLTEKEEETRFCEFFETCTFIELATITKCYVAIKLSIELLDEADRVVHLEEIYVSPLEPGSLRVVEIGSNSNVDFEFFNTLDISCVDQALPI